MKCPNGHENVESARFCAVCGLRIGDSERASTPISHSQPKKSRVSIVPWVISGFILGSIVGAALGWFQRPGAFGIQPSVSDYSRYPELQEGLISTMLSWILILAIVGAVVGALIASLNRRG